MTRKNPVRAFVEWARKSFRLLLAGVRSRFRRKTRKTSRPAQESVSMNRKQRRTFASLRRRNKLHALPLSLFSRNQCQYLQARF